jgi:hypothetical protein
LEQAVSSDLLAIYGSAAEGFGVYHAPSGLIVPSGIPGGAQYPGKRIWHNVNRFQNKTTARKYLAALEKAEILTSDTSHDAILRFRDWLIANYPK